MAESRRAGVGVKYTPDVLLFLRDSPLCVKPAGLPPADEWMGPPPETTRNQIKPTTERAKAADGSLSEQRRPGLDRTTSRSSANPEDIILGPPRTSFASATSGWNSRLGELEKGTKDAEPRDRPERFNFRTKSIDVDNNRTNNSAFRRRGDADQDSEGWSTVKPRKSFGTEGAERFHGRMGGSDRTTGRDDRRFRERDDRDNGERRNRNTDQGLREKDSEEADGSRWNGFGRGKTEPRARGKDSEEAADGSRWNGVPRSKTESRARENSDGGAPLTGRERIDRARSWRDPIPEDKPAERQSDRVHDRGYDRRWDREREHKDPEWMDEPAGDKSQGRTAEDLQKFMESMKASHKTSDRPAAEVHREAEQQVRSVPATESAQDKFFAAFGAGATLDIGSPSAEAKESSRPKTGKSSRFTSFFSAVQEDPRGRTEPPTPAAAPPPPNGTNAPPQQNDDDKAAFAVLLQKLILAPSSQAAQPQPQPTPSFSEQSSTAAMTPGVAPRPPSGLTAGLPPSMQHGQSALTSPEPFQQYGGDRREDGRLRGPPPPPSTQDTLSPRPMAPASQHPPPLAPGLRPEQALLHEMLAQHPHGMGQGSGRHEQPGLNQNPAPVNNNTEFLMRLMQSARAAPEPLRTEQLLVRNPQPTQQVKLPNLHERESNYDREQRGAPQPQPQPPHRQMRPQGAPAFFDAQFHSPDHDGRPQHPTQILQRPPPPGLDHQIPPMHMGSAPQMPPQRGPMIPPPPGLNNMMNNARNGPDPRMFAPPNLPNFPPPGFRPLPDSMPVGGPGLALGPGLVNMQGPSGFYGGMPPPGLPGFMPPPGAMGGFQGGPPDAGMQFPGGPPPFDGRNMPPHGGAGGAFRRQ